MSAVHHSFLGDYYGLDWLTLACGVSGNFMTTNMGKLHIGMSIGLFSCMGGMAVAVMSAQYGFVVYNAILLGLNLRGLHKIWCRSQRLKQQTSVAAERVHVQSAAVNDQAPVRDPYRSELAAAA